MDYKEAMRKAKEEAARQAKLLWPEAEKEQRRREVDRLTLHYYRQYTRP